MGRREVMAGQESKTHRLSLELSRNAFTAATVDTGIDALCQCSCREGSSMVYLEGIKHNPLHLILVLAGLWLISVEWAPWLVA